MHGPRRLLALLAIALGAVPALASQQRPDTLVIVTGGDISLPIPGTSRPVEAVRISELLFLRLGRFAGTSYGDRAAVPQLARNWKRIDSLTLAFALDPRARWHDGTPVTPNDVLFSFERARNPGRAPSIAALLGGIRSVEADATGRIIIRFTRPYGEQLYDATYHVQILPRHLLAGIPADSLAVSRFAQAPVGNGPYRWSRYLPGQLVELAAVPDFFLGAPAIDRVIWLVTSSQEARLNEVLGGTAEIMEDLIPPVANLARLKARPELRLAHFPSQNVAYLLFNQRNPKDSAASHPVFKSPAVRRALTLGVDRATMIKALLGDYASTVSGPTPKAAWYRTLAPEPLPFSPRAARALLAKDGWRDSDGDGTLDRDGQPLRFTLLVPTSSTVRLQLAQIVEQQWRAIGVDAQVQPVEGSIWRSERLAGRFDITVESYAHDPSPWGLLDLWGCKGANNLARYCNPVADSLLEQAHWSAADPAPALTRYFSTLSTDYPAVFLFSRDYVLPIPRKYRSPGLHPESPYLMVWTWTPRAGR
jgi:peptide/nickel transport system substrate-binding protein